MGDSWFVDLGLAQEQIPIWWIFGASKFAVGQRSWGQGHLPVQHCLWRDDFSLDTLSAIFLHAKEWRNPFAEVEQKRLQHGVLVLEDCFGLGFATCALIGRTGMSVECLVSGRRTSVALCDMVPGGSLHSAVDEQAAIWSDTSTSSCVAFIEDQ